MKAYSGVDVRPKHSLLINRVTHLSSTIFIILRRKFKIIALGQILSIFLIDLIKFTITLQRVINKQYERMSTWRGKESSDDTPDVSVVYSKLPVAGISRSRGHCSSGLLRAMPSKFNNKNYVLSLTIPSPEFLTKGRATQENPLLIQSVGFEDKKFCYKIICTCIISYNLWTYDISVSIQTIPYIKPCNGMWNIHTTEYHMGQAFVQVFSPRRLVCNNFRTTAQDVKPTSVAYW
jgi:hypothetical protein